MLECVARTLRRLRRRSGGAVGRRILRGYIVYRWRDTVCCSCYWSSGSTSTGRAAVRLRGSHRWLCKAGRSSEGSARCNGRRTACVLVCGRAAGQPYGEVPLHCSGRSCRPPTLLPFGRVLRTCTKGRSTGSESRSTISYPPVNILGDVLTWRFLGSTPTVTRAVRDYSTRIRWWFSLISDEFDM